MSTPRDRHVPVFVYFQGIIKDPNKNEEKLRRIFFEGEKSLFAIKQRYGWKLLASMIRTCKDPTHEESAREIVNVWQLGSATQYVASSESIKNYKQYTAAISLFKSMSEHLHVPTITKLEKPGFTKPPRPTGFLDDLIVTWQQWDAGDEPVDRVAHIDVDDYKKKAVKHPVMEMMVRRGVAWAELPGEPGNTQDGNTPPKNLFANLAVLRQLTHVEHEPG